MNSLDPETPLPRTGSAAAAHVRVGRKSSRENARAARINLNDNDAAQMPARSPSPGSRAKRERDRATDQPVAWPAQQRRRLEVDKENAPESSSDEEGGQEGSDEEGGQEGSDEEGGEGLVADALSDGETPQEEDVYQPETGEHASGIRAARQKPSLHGLIPANAVNLSPVQEIRYQQADDTAATLRLEYTVSDDALRAAESHRVLPAPEPRQPGPWTLQHPGILQADHEFALTNFPAAPAARAALQAALDEASTPEARQRLQTMAYQLGADLSTREMLEQEPCVAITHFGEAISIVTNEEDRVSGVLTTEDGSFDLTTRPPCACLVMVFSKEWMDVVQRGYATPAYIQENTVIKDFITVYARDLPVVNCYHPPFIGRLLLTGAPVFAKSVSNWGQVRPGEDWHQAVCGTTAGMRVLKKGVCLARLAMAIVIKVVARGSNTVKQAVKDGLCAPSPNVNKRLLLTMPTASSNGKKSVAKAEEINGGRRFSAAQARITGRTDTETRDEDSQEMVQAISEANRKNGSKNLQPGDKTAKGKVVTKSTNERKGEGGEHHCEGMVL
eukprot:TRINITY_DN2193_c0_g1_i1.p1 TRINITY_DN2193_c0_g1~~TRINITY_DN2193_c0_g1_i1.p1  ORF type:complete len:559 (+),score=131.13 TRINITY_DN2193_c0_g1_i1:341-2017(+)